MSLPGVLRALHAEAWNKLVYPVTGTMFTAIVDIRPERPSFGQVETLTLDAAEPSALFVPSGLANSICVVGDEPVHYLYVVDAYYDGTDTRAVAWDDPDLGDRLAGHRPGALGTRPRQPAPARPVPRPFRAVTVTGSGASP